MLFVFTIISGSVPNRRPSPLPELGLFSLSSFRGEDKVQVGMNSMAKVR